MSPDPYFPTKTFEGPAYNDDDFLQTCAHEVGHILFLSTREDRMQKPADWASHDGGPFPEQQYYRDGTKVPPEKRKDKSDEELKKRLRFGLMSTGSPSGRWDWMRREDWKEANERAKKLFRP